MNRKRACDILNLDYKFNHKELRKKYLQLALQYHPDKNPDGEEYFKDIHASYVFLDSEFTSSTSTNYKFDHDEFFNLNTLSEYLYVLFDIDKNVYTCIETIINNTCAKANKIIHNIDNLTILKLKRFVKIHGYLFKLSKDTMDMFSTELSKYSNKKEIITINPSLDELLNCSISVINTNENTFYIPLWYHELEYETCIVEIIPNLPDHMLIDDNNNLHVFITLPKETIFNTDEFEINICNNTYTISKERLQFKQRQTIQLKESRGIPQINEPNQDKDVSYDIFTIISYGTIFIEVTIQ